MRDTSAGSSPKNRPGADIEHDGQAIDVPALAHQVHGGVEQRGRRLSTTNQPWSSSARAAVERPALDMPVTSSSSGSSFTALPCASMISPWSY